LSVLHCLALMHLNSSLPPTNEDVYVFARFRLSVGLSDCWQDYSKTRAAMDLDEMLRVDRYLDTDELINF